MYCGRRALCPPGYGLNNGLEDVSNLGWKLAAKLQGWGSDALLRSYSEERRPIFKETADDFIAARIKKDGEILSRYRPDRDREEFERVWKALESDTGSAQDYEPNYEGSPVIMGSPGGFAAPTESTCSKLEPGTISYQRH